MVQWCETQRDCNRLRLVDILVGPMQRLTKYSLLLKAVLKNTEDINQRRDLLEMVGNPVTRGPLLKELKFHFLSLMYSAF